MSNQTNDEILESIKDKTFDILASMNEIEKAKMLCEVGFEKFYTKGEYVFTGHKWHNEAINKVLKPVKWETPKFLKSDNNFWEWILRKKAND